MGDFHTWNPCLLFQFYINKFKSLKFLKCEFSEVNIFLFYLLSSKGLERGGKHQTDTLFYTTKMCDYVATIDLFFQNFVGYYNKGSFLRNAQYMTQIIRHWFVLQNVAHPPSFLQLKLFVHLSAFNYNGTTFSIPLF